MRIRNLIYCLLVSIAFAAIGFHIKQEKPIEEEITFEDEPVKRKKKFREPASVSMSSLPVQESIKKPAEKSAVLQPFPEENEDLLSPIEKSVNDFVEPIKKKFSSFRNNSSGILPKTETSKEKKAPSIGNQAVFSNIPSSIPKAAFQNDSDNGDGQNPSSDNSVSNPTNPFPRVELVQAQTFFQTTELDKFMLVASDNFGNANYEIGVLNLKTHDPGPLGLDLSCSDIVANYASLPAPVPVSVLPLLDVSGYLGGDEVDVPLVLADLEYGDNFITSFLKNSSTTTPSYTCSTSKIVLEDFDYFEQSVAQVDLEFTGGFTSVGFFEPELETAQPRTPAGESSQNHSGELLKSSLLSVFH